MNDVLTMAEIERRFDQEWVLLENPETTENLEIRRARVLWHSRDRDEVWRKAHDLMPLHSAVLYIGELPEDMIYVL